MMLNALRDVFMQKKVGLIIYAHFEITWSGVLQMMQTKERFYPQSEFYVYSVWQTNNQNEVSPSLGSDEWNY